MLVPRAGDSRGVLGYAAAFLNRSCLLWVKSRHSAMSALPPIADIGTQSRDVRFVPKADIVRCGERHRYSITSSALVSKDCGTVKPIAFAVLRLISSSYLVGACTGRSPGFSPLRMRST